MTSNVPLSSMNRHLVIGTLVVSTYKYLAFDQPVSGHAQGWRCAKLPRWDHGHVGARPVGATAIQ